MNQTELIHANNVLEFHRIEYKKNVTCSKHKHEFKWAIFCRKQQDES